MNLFSSPLGYASLCSSSSPTAKTSTGCWMVMRTRQGYCPGTTGMADLDHNTEVLEDVQVRTTDVDAWSIVLYNDDVNTFDWVILCLKKYCGHNHIQAEQCAWVVHTKGKCLV